MTCTHCDCDAVTIAFANGADLSSSTGRLFDSTAATLQLWDACTHKVPEPHPDHEEVPQRSVNVSHGDDTKPQCRVHRVEVEGDPRPKGAVDVQPRPHHVTDAFLGRAAVVVVLVRLWVAVAVGGNVPVLEQPHARTQHRSSKV